MVALYSFLMTTLDTIGAIVATMLTAEKILPTSSGPTHRVKNDLKAGAA